MDHDYYNVFECQESKDGKSPMIFLARGSFSTRREAVAAADSVRNRQRSGGENKPLAAIYSKHGKLIQPVT